MPKVRLTGSGSINFLYDPGDGAKEWGLVKRAIYIDQENVELAEDEANQALLYSGVMLVKEPPIAEEESITEVIEEIVETQEVVEEPVTTNVTVETYLEMTVTELKDVISSMSLGELKAVRFAELFNKNRSTAIEVLDAAIAAFSVPSGE